MAEGNGELLDDINQKADDRGDGERTEDYPKLLEYGLDKKVLSNYGKILAISISDAPFVVCVTIRSPANWMKSTKPANLLTPSWTSAHWTRSRSFLLMVP